MFASTDLELVWTTLIVVAVVAVVDVADALAEFAFPDEPFAGVGRGDDEFDGHLPPDGEFKVEFTRAVPGILPECPGHARQGGQERAVGGDANTSTGANTIARNSGSEAHHR